jgi:hypothetical protein
MTACERGILTTHLDDVRQYYATYIIISFVPYLPDDALL